MHRHKNYIQNVTFVKPWLFNCYCMSTTKENIENDAWIETLSKFLILTLFEKSSMRPISGYVNK